MDSLGCDKNENRPIGERILDLDFDCYLPALLKETLNNKGAEALATPFRITLHILEQLAELALDIDDPRLHLMMVRLGLYEFKGHREHGKQREDLVALVREYNERGDHRVNWNTPGLRAFLKREAHTEGDLKDWYQHSVDSRQDPVWTDKHIEEVVKDYWLIPKPIKETEK